MAERTNATVLKTVEASRSPGVRIPLLPPFEIAGVCPVCCNPAYGEVPESGRSGLPAKEVAGNTARGFESHPLRSQ